MQVFYTDDIQNQKAFFEGQEAHHIVKVLRHQQGDVLNWVDGLGYRYRGEIVEITKRRVTARVIERIEVKTSRKGTIHLVIAPTKNMTRMEWLIEKLCEIGIDQISFVICQNSERRSINMDKVKKKIISASKQSKKARFPRVNTPLDFREFIDLTHEEASIPRYIAHCRDRLEPLVKRIEFGKGGMVMIGPEGDFTKEEIQYAESHGWMAVGLGVERLRTETAALVACQNFHTIHQLHTE